MLQDMNIDDPTWYARSGDPDTSQEAARMTRGQVSLMIYDAIVYYLRTYGAMTGERMERLVSADPEVGRYITPSGLRTRRKALERRGVVQDTGLRTQGSNGRSMIVWALTQQ
jgi:hypothetical protein